MRCFESYLGNCKRHGRSPEFVVADDSSNAAAANRTKEALRTLASRSAARVFYAGWQEKDRFVASLATESAVSPEIIRFALFGDGRCGLTSCALTSSGLTTGANRNSLLLDTTGSLILSVDDDTICRIAEAPERRPTLSFFAGYDPTEFWFFPDRNRASQFLSSADVDVLGCHDTLLGRVVTDLSDGTSGRVAMTLNGLAGDSGMASPRYYLTLTGASRERLVASVGSYRSAFQSREILRCVRQPTITRSPFCMSTFLGLDNRLLLPPFFPLQRNSDGIFGQMLPVCLEGSCTAFLPWILHHAPEPVRTFAPEDSWTDAASLRMADFVIAGIIGHESSSHETSSRDVSDPVRFVSLGKHLRWVGSLTLPDFEEYVCSVRNFQNFGLITTLHGQLAAYGGFPGFWADDVSRMIDVLSHASATEYLVPRDLLHDRDVDAARRLAQELIAKFGELLEAWPEIVAAAARLRGNGYRLASEL